MKIVLWLLFLCVLLYFNLGNVIIPMETISPPRKKYKSPPDYYNDVFATQGVFSKVVESMTTQEELDGQYNQDLPYQDDPEIGKLKKIQRDSLYQDQMPQDRVYNRRLKNFQRDDQDLPYQDEPEFGNLKNFQRGSLYQDHRPQGPIYVGKLKTFQRGDQAIPYQGQGVEYEGNDVQESGNIQDSIQAISEQVSKDILKTLKSSTYKNANPQYQDNSQNSTVNCQDSLYGCCADGVTPKFVDGTCMTVPLVQNCVGTAYGCCPDGVTNKNVDGSNCKPACVTSQYGCCDDGITARTSTGCPNPTPTSSTCTGSPYGCCPDNITVKNSTGSNCSSYPPNIYILPIQVPDQNQTSQNQTSQNQTSQNQTSQNQTSQNQTSQNQTSQNQTSQTPQYQTSTSYQPNSQQSYYQSQPNNFVPSNPSPDLFNKPVQSVTDTVFLSAPKGNPYAPNCPKPQPCPPCGRCPEPSFECKKVPNYSSLSDIDSDLSSNSGLPVPVLSDFSQFGM